MNPKYIYYVVMDTETLDILAIFNNKRMADLFVDKYYAKDDSKDLLVKRGNYWVGVINEQQVDQIVKASL